MYADGGLDAADAAALDRHVDACLQCQARVTALRAEVARVADCLALGAEPARVPDFERPTSRAVAIAVGALLVVATTLASTMPGLLGFALPAPLAWLDPFDRVRLVELAIRLALYVALHGGEIMMSIAETVAMAVVAGLVLWAGFALRARLSGASLLVSLVVLVVALPVPVNALEIRHVKDGTVSVPAGETIADTLIAAGETVEIDGNVEGDLIAVGRRVAIRGHVGGQVVTAATTVTIDGEVDSSVLGFARTLEIASPRIGRNLYGFGETVRTAGAANVAQNAVVGAQRADVGGPVGRDVLAFAEDVEIGSSLGGTLTAFAERITLLAPARIAGDVAAHIADPNELTISPGAVVAGEVVTHAREHRIERHAWTSAEHWTFQLLRFTAAFLAGLVLLALVPALRGVSLDGVSGTLVAGAFGIVTLVAMPIIAVLVAVTVIGLPLAFFGLVLWIAGIYFAKVVLAHAVGTRLLGRSGLLSGSDFPSGSDIPSGSEQTRHFAAPLAAGLLLVIVVVNLPFVGGLFNFLMTIAGLGLLVLFLRDRWRVLRDR